MSRSHDHFKQSFESERVALLAPLVVLVLAATAVPVELRRFDSAAISWESGAWDMAANVLGYIPVGIVLAHLGFWRGALVTTLLTFVAEACQFFMMHRFPSPIDLGLNVAGAMIGLWIGWRWRIDAMALQVNARTAFLPALAALALLGIKVWSDWDELVTPRGTLLVSSRGATSPGTLEALWTFDETAAGVVSDSSGNGLGGTLKGGASLAEGVHGKAVQLDGKQGYVDFGQPVELRLMGSLTISAWINSASFPADDAAIVSSHSPGYQLDTTVDTGPRTIGFKLVDACGNLMARYGTTALARDTWYHVAGVYDTDARTLNVYLNGQLDDGSLVGPVAIAQHESSQRVCVGRRADASGYEFAGLIDDVRIDSRALSGAEIERVMHDVRSGSRAATKAEQAPAREILAQRMSGRGHHCHQPTRSEDSLVPGLAAAVGVLLGLACAGFWPGRRLPIVAVSLSAGLLLGWVAAITLPPYVPWIIPLLSLAGGLSVAVSLSRGSQRV